jgi:elongation factor Ts
MSISMQQVKELRDRTQAGLNDCKNALSEAAGDMEKAVELILKKGLAKSAKRAGAIAAEGVVAARVAQDGKSGIMVEVNIQTDFAARNPDFLAFVEQVVDAAGTASDGQNLGDVEVAGETIEARRAALVGKLGENVTVRRWTRVSVEQGFVHAYIHMGGKIGALIGLSMDEAGSNRAEARQFADDVAMQVAAMAPLYARLSDVPDADRQKQSEIFAGQLEEEGKATRISTAVTMSTGNTSPRLCARNPRQPTVPAAGIRKLQETHGSQAQRFATGVSS